jgi:endonuclease/exonuclease/phosphatase family metal-dependent hydrolase
MLETQTISQTTAIIPVERLTFGWWNTSLSPVGKNRADDNHKQIAQTIVKSLIDGLKIDCLALGEVTSADLASMTEACVTDGLAVYDGTLKSGRLQFDTGAIYNSQRLHLANSMSTMSAHGQRNLKIANRIDFTASDRSPFHVFISHWPSRGIVDENILARETVADRLRTQITELEDVLPGAAIIVMGDFNDEPFDRSLAWHMLATRDRELARGGRGYLYNPFWRRLGEAKPYSYLRTEDGVAGSCVYTRETSTHWRTFDQILFSSAFLGNAAWHLNEGETNILRTVDLVALLRDQDLHFDHLPVFSVVERLVKEE